MRRAPAKRSARSIGEQAGESRRGVRAEQELAVFARAPGSFALDPPRSAWARPEDAGGTGSTVGAPGGGFACRVSPKADVYGKRNAQPSCSTPDTATM